MKKLTTLFATLSVAIGLLLGSKVSQTVDDPTSVSITRPASSLFADDRFPKEIGYPSFMSPHALPVAIHGQNLFVVNTPADTVDIVNLQTREVQHRVSVGVDPVSIAVRPDGNEVWVSNHVSDSVSVIDSDASSTTYLQVVATIQDFDTKTRSTRFDEPVGIAFASSEKAYVALSSENEIAVIDVASRQISKRLKIRSQDPRQIVVHNSRLYVIPFESNNQTQLSGGNKDDIDGELVTFDSWDHSVANNNVLSIGHVVDVVKHPEVPDRDLYVFDTTTDELVETVDTLGTLLYGMDVNSKGEVFVAQTDARNDVNGRSGTQGQGLKELDNRMFLNRITRVDLSAEASASQQAGIETAEPTVEFFDLEPLPPEQPKAEEAVATPFAVAVSKNDQALFVTAAGSDQLVSLDAKTGKILGRVGVGGVPRGIALESSGSETARAWVFNAVDNSISYVDVSDLSDLSVIDTIQLEDPTRPDIKRGRKVFNSAGASTTGTFSCASCHPDGHTDQLLWVLKTPVVTGGDQIMPRSTMPIRGLRETAPFHWDGIPGDPYGGNNSANVYRHVEPNCADSPEAPVRHLIDGALASTMAIVGDNRENDEGKVGMLAAMDRDALAKFLLSVPYPPAQRRSYTNELSGQALKGFELFHVSGDDDPTKIDHNVCGDCHRMPNWVSTNTPGTGMDTPTWRGAYDRWLILPQGRLNIIEFDFFRRVAEDGLAERRIWQFSWAGRRRFDPVWNMVLEGSTGYSGTYARQVTLNTNTAKSELTLDLLRAMETSALEEAIIVQVNGVFLNDQDPNPVELQFKPMGDQGRYFVVDGDVRQDERTSYSQSQLISQAISGSFLGTFTAHMGAGHGDDRLQPVLWTEGPIEQQRGHQEFPFLYDGHHSMVTSGRHIDPNAQLIVNGRRASGALRVDGETIMIELDELPSTGIHMLQVQNPDGLFSNDFIFHVAENRESAEEAKRQINRTRTDSRTSLIHAVSSDDVEEVKFLLQHGSDVDARHPEEGGTALSAAALRGNLRMAKLLIENGADVQRANRDGNTSLHVAAFLCRFDIVELLLESGAVIATENNRQQTSADVVSGEWNEGLASFYQSIADSSGFNIDLKKVEDDRKKMAKLLETHED